MDEFELDKELHETLAGIRESVRKLFEQLRLKTESGDISGKDRLERVPAFAKRNFRNLAGPVSLRAIKEAWRLIDFLEGEGEARLTPRAREALRIVELDQQLARLRASDRWKDAAARLREALGAAADPDQGYSGGSATEVKDGFRGEDPADLAKAGTEPVSLPDALRRPTVGMLAGVAIPIAFAALTARWLLGIPADPRFACLALERASIAALATHWAVDPGTSPPLPAPNGARPNSAVFTISDPVRGPVRSIWTTSQFSFEEGVSHGRPGGGKADVRLRVGGWGDTYLSLLQFPIPDNRLVRRASIRLVVLGDYGSRPTTMTLRVVAESWRVSPGPQPRLWWRDCPRSEAVRRHLPAPGPRDSIYEIDITDIYNRWATGAYVNHGIMLEPEHIGSYGRSSSHYANFSTFYSTRALDPANRPKLVLTY
ncbi:MAG TPA: DNRLRE domain-containing protein [Allosphingosinicella sp.]|nr:DNRLRE domain-containing protein [Allosphingosinicella sp.]